MRDKIKSITYQNPNVTNQTDIKILEVIYRFTCIRAWDVAVLAGIGSVSYTNRCLLRLYRCNLLESTYYAGEKIYAITAKGTSQIGKDPIYGGIEKHLSQINFYLSIARLAAVLFIKNDELHLDSIITKRLLESEYKRSEKKEEKGIWSYPDLIIEKTAYQLATNGTKVLKKDSLRRAMQSNDLYFEKQIWVYNDQLPGQKNKLKEAQNVLSMDKPVEIISFQQICPDAKIDISLQELSKKYSSRKNLVRWEYVPCSMGAPDILRVRKRNKTGQTEEFGKLANSTITQILKKAVIQEIKRKEDGNRHFWADEVTVGHSFMHTSSPSDHKKTPDILECIVPNNANKLEEFKFISYEIKSSINDIYSGNGLNFIGDENFLVMTAQTYKNFLPDINSGKFNKYLKKTFPFCNGYNILVSIPKGTQNIANELLQPSSPQQVAEWELYLIFSYSDENTFLKEKEIKNTRDLLFALMSRYQTLLKKEEK